jgi:hypothetical protein
MNMNRFSTAAVIASFALLAACDVTDNNNGSTTIAIDDEKIEAGAEALANEASEVGDKAADVLRNAGPEIEQSASDIKERAGRVADKVDNMDVDVDLNTADDKPAPRAN